jgi:hypothetical protein
MIFFFSVPLWLACSLPCLFPLSTLHFPMIVFCMARLPTVASYPRRFLQQKAYCIFVNCAKFPAHFMFFEMEGHTFFFVSPRIKHFPHNAPSSLSYFPSHRHDICRIFCSLGRSRFRGFYEVLDSRYVGLQDAGHLQSWGQPNGVSTYPLQTCPSFDTSRIIGGSFCLLLLYGKALYLRMRVYFMFIIEKDLDVTCIGAQPCVE